MRLYCRHLPVDIRDQAVGQPSKQSLTYALHTHRNNHKPEAFCLLLTAAAVKTCGFFEACSVLGGFSPDSLPTRHVVLVASHPAFIECDDLHACLQFSFVL